MTFLAYADPGADVPNPRLAAIGYQQDDRPITAQPSTIRPYRPSFETGSPDEPIELAADAVVVGSGAGGGVVAAALARAGRSVIVVEAGPFVDETQMPGDELDAFGRLYLNHGLLTTWDGSVTMLAGSGVGGGTLINWMTSIPAPEWVREDWRRDHGIEGVTGAAWDADVGAVEDELNVSETVAIPPKDAVILRGAAALGWEAAPTRRNATDCDACGSCPFGCRRGTKRSVMRVHLEQAHALGARILSRTRVVRIITEGGAATGVEAHALLTDPTTGEVVVDAGGGTSTRRVVVRAPIVVLSAGALRTPAILQASGFEHPAIGRHLRLHPAPVVAGIFPDPIDMWRGTMQAARSWSSPNRARAATATSSSRRRAIPGSSRWPCRGRDDAHADIMLRSRRIAPLVAVTRDGGSGRTTLTKAGGVRIDYRLDAGRRAHAAPCTRLDGSNGPGGRSSRDPRRRNAALVAWSRRPRPGARGDRLCPVRVVARVVRPVARTAAACSRPTRWAPSGWAPIRATIHAIRGAGSARMAAPTATSAGSTSPTARSSRPVSVLTR